MRTIQELFREPPRASLLPNFILERALQLEQMHSDAIANTDAASMAELRAGLVEAERLDEAGPELGHARGVGVRDRVAVHLLELECPLQDEVRQKRGARRFTEELLDCAHGHRLLAESSSEATDEV